LSPTARRRAALHSSRPAEHHVQAAERLHREVKVRYWQILDDAVSAGEAKAALLALAGNYRSAYPAAIKTIDEHVDQLVAHLRLPLEHRKRTRSTNLLKRTFVEVRRRTKIIGRFPGKTSALSLIWAVLELASRGWRAVTMTPKAVAQIKRIRRGQSTHIDRSTSLIDQKAIAA
jgi:putative transposase